MMKTIEWEVPDPIYRELERAANEILDGCDENPGRPSLEDMISMILSVCIENDLDFNKVCTLSYEAIHSAYERIAEGERR